MPNPFTLEDSPDLVNRSKKVYLKTNMTTKKKVKTEDGYMPIGKTGIHKMPNGHMMKNSEMKKMMKKEKIMK